MRDYYPLAYFVALVTAMLMHFLNEPFWLSCFLVAIIFLLSFLIGIARNAFYSIFDRDEDFTNDYLNRKDVI